MPSAVDAERFYSVSLAGSGGRAAVRDWLDVTVGEAKRHLARYFRLHSVVDRYRMPEVVYLPLWRLVAATVPPRARQKAPAAAVSRAVYRVALAGGAVPLDVLFAVVRRIRADQEVSPERAALMKLVLLSQEGARWKEDQFVALERDVTDVAYLCGRLLAALEETQRQALGDIGATVVDRFYGAASSTPVAVFPRLVRGAQPHLAKLRRDKYGLYVRLESEITEICTGIPTRRDALGKAVAAYPPSLTLAEQGLFSLGYYHQRAEYFRPRSTARVPAEAEPTPSESILENEADR